MALNLTDPQHIANIKLLHELLPKMPKSTQLMDGIPDVPHLLLPDGRSIVVSEQTYDLWSEPRLNPKWPDLGYQPKMEHCGADAQKAIAWAWKGGVK